MKPTKQEIEESMRRSLLSYEEVKTEEVNDIDVSGILPDRSMINSALIPAELL